MKAKKSQSMYLSIMAVCAVCAIDLLCGAGYLYFVHVHGGTLFSARNASSNLWQTLAQGLATTAFPFLLFIVLLCVLKKDFFSAMYLRIDGKRQILAVVVLTVLLAVMTAVCLSVKQDKITILYNLFYYLVLIAFTEEFVIRGVCVYLLKNFSWKVRYFVPNAAFAVMHIFAYADFEALSFAYILHFVTSNILGLMAAGMLFQFLKEKSGTLWVPILIHAVCDYSVIFSYS